MTRHRRGPTDGDDGNAPWRARDYGRPARQPDTARDYSPAPWDEPARGALGTSSGGDADPGEVTGPPWELPGWDDSQPGRRAPRQGGLTGGHPSGPLPRVSSGPLPRVPPDSWPGAAGPSDPLAPLPRGARGWADPPGAGDPGRGRERSPSGYPPDPYLDGDAAGYPSAGREAYPGREDDAPYLRTGYTGTGYGDSREADADYPGTDSGYLDYGEPATDVGGYGHVDYGEPGYPDEPGYAGDDFADEEYAPEPGYPPGAGYPAGEGYLPEEQYPAENGYARGGGYPPQAGYPGEEAGYLGDEYLGGRGAASGRVRDPEGDHGYGDPGDWYGDVDDDQAWADDDYDEGFVPGLTSDVDTRHARVGGPGIERTGRAVPPGPGRMRGRGGGKGRKGPMRRAAPWIALSVLVVVLAGLGSVGYYLYRNYFHPPDYSGAGTGSVTVHIQSGETATQVGQQLQQLGVVASVRAFSNAAKASGHGTALQPGYYRLHKHMAAALAFALLLNPSSRIQVTYYIPEGQRLYEIINLLGKDSGNLKGYQQAAKNIAGLGLPSYAKGNPEGYLFPATYTVQPGTSPLTVLRDMVQRFNQEAASVSLPSVAQHDQITEGDAITIASIVQAEGRTPQDMANIARVIYNRLNQGIALQLDSTVLYALHSRAPDITAAQAHNTNSPYNTYLHVGLPPGPIDSPGAAAIYAALHPTKGHHDWLYFLTVNPKTGKTDFTGSYAQFQIWEAQLAAYNAKH